MLQQILFYKELGFELQIIKDIITQPSFDIIEALKSHRNKLLKKKSQINILLDNIEKTIAHHEGRIAMSDNEKFNGFKQQMIDENEKQYGKEIRDKYGNEVVNQSYQKLKNMSKEEFEKLQNVQDELYSTLKLAMETNDPASELAQKAAKLHKEWLCFYWPKYNKEAHRNLAQMYVDDERFKKYYDNIHPKCAEFLRDAIIIFTQKNT